MSKNEIQNWLNSPNSLALRVESSDLKGLIGSRFTVPEDACALVQSSPGRSEVLVSGEGRKGDFSALLVKTAQVELDFTFDDLLSKDDLPVAATCKLTFSVVPKRSDLELFGENALGKKASFSLEDLRLLLHEHVKRGLYDYILSQTTEEIYRRDHSAQLEVAVTSALKKVMFDCGLDFKGMKDLTLRSEAYENLIAQRAKAKAAQEDAAIEMERAEAEIQSVETHKRREMAEELAEREVEHERALKAQQLRSEAQKQSAETARERELLQQQAQHELERAELQQRIESDDIEAEAKAERVRQLNEIFKEADLKTLVEEIKDERVRAKLYSLLIKKEMSPDQLEAMKHSDELTEKIDEAIDRLLQVAQSLPAAAGRPNLFGEDPQLDWSKSGSRIIVAADKRILCFDLNAPAATTPTETHFFENGSLGYLRSVRFDPLQRLILAGAQSGVYVRHLFGGAPPREFVFPHKDGVRTGANSAACCGDSLFATHSEYGLVRWRIGEPSRGEKLFPHLTPTDLSPKNANRKSTRGVTITDDGSLFFSNGPDIYRASLSDLSLAPAIYRRWRPRRPDMSSPSVTAFVVSNDLVFAGTSEGQIFRWRRDGQASPTLLAEGKGAPVYSLKMLVMNGIPHLLVGRKEKGVLAIRPDGVHGAFFAAPGPIRWVEGIDGFVCGVGKTERDIYVWRTDDPSEIAFAIPTAEKVHDIISA